MYSDAFCKVYNEFGWNYYPEIFGEQLLRWLGENHVEPQNALDLGCGTGILCEILHRSGIKTSGMDFSAGMIEIAKAGNPDIHYEVADMIIYRPEERFDLVTCTGDALNHIGDLENVERIFRNVYAYLSPGGYFIFDILNEHEVSTSEPFDMDFSDTIRVWFQMTRPGEKQPSRGGLTGALRSTTDTSPSTLTLSRLTQRALPSPRRISIPCRRRPCGSSAARSTRPTCLSPRIAGNPSTRISRISQVIRVLHRLVRFVPGDAGVGAQHVRGIMAALLADDRLHQIRRTLLRPIGHLHPSFRQQHARNSGNA